MLYNLPSVHFCSPSGKLVQIEYALAAVGAGSPSVGIKGNYLYLLIPFLHNFSLNAMLQTYSLLSVSLNTNTSCNTCDSLGSLSAVAGNY